MTAAEDIGGQPEPELARAVELVRRVPHRYREFRRTAIDAQWHHRIGPELLDALVELGLPSAGNAGNLLFDELDLANVSLILRLPSARMLVMRGWRAALNAAVSGQPTRYSLTIKPQCPRPDHAGACEMVAAPGLRKALGIDSESGHSELQVERLVHGRTTLLTGAARAVIDLVTVVTFHLLPFELRGDLTFLRDTGLADCVLAAHYLVDEARAREIEVRFSHGVFLASPFSIDHCWAEFLVDGDWVAVDPHLLRTLARLGLVDPLVWPPHRSLSDAAWRVDGEDRPFMTDRGSRAMLSLPTIRVGAA